MNIALVFQHKLLQGLGRLAGYKALPAKEIALARCTVSHASPKRPAAAAVAATNIPLARKPMPLRVLRVVESGQPRSCTGRLVISGRMADVCAELDRLVAKEAALH